MAENCICRIELEIGNPGGVVLAIDDDSQAALEMGDAVIIGGTAPIYDGEVEVTPKVNAEQILMTRNHLMMDDVTIHKITVNNVSNPYGGQTVTIGVV